MAARQVSVVWLRTATETIDAKGAGERLLRQFAGRVEKLKKEPLVLHVFGVNAATATAVFAMLAGSPLVEVRLENVASETGKDDDLLFALESVAPTLEVLSVVNCGTLGGRAVAHCGLTNLRTLAVRRGARGDVIDFARPSAFWEAVAAMPRLTKLVVADIFFVAAEPSATAAQFDEMEELGPDAAFYSPFRGAIAFAPNLVDLRIEGNRIGPNAQRALIHEIGHCKTLDSLSLANMNLGRDALRLLYTVVRYGMPALEGLDLVGNPQYELADLRELVDAAHARQAHGLPALEINVFNGNTGEIERVQKGDRRLFFAVHKLRERLDE
jgi:hypothetical protein